MHKAISATAIAVLVSSTAAAANPARKAQDDQKNPSSAARKGFLEKGEQEPTDAATSTCLT